MMKGGTGCFLFTLLLATTLLTPDVLSRSTDDYPTRMSLDASSRNQEWECEEMESTKVGIIHPDGDRFTCEMFGPDEDIWDCRSKASYAVKVFSPEGVGFRCSGSEAEGFRVVRICYMLPNTRVRGFVPDGVGFLGFVEEDERGRGKWRCNMRIREDTNHGNKIKLPPGHQIFSAAGMTFTCHEKDSSQWKCKLLSSDLDEPPKNFIFDVPGSLYGGTSVIRCNEGDGGIWSCSPMISTIIGTKLTCKACHFRDTSGRCRKNILCEERMNAWPFFDH